MDSECWSRDRWTTGEGHRHPKCAYARYHHTSFETHGECVFRDEFKLKLALLSNQWQGVVRRAQQRRGIIDSLLRQWQRYREMGEKLRKWLVEVSHQAVTLQAGAPVPLQQARAMLDAVQVNIL